MNKNPNERLLAAAATGNVKNIIAATKQSTNLQYKNSEGLTFLHCIFHHADNYSEVVGEVLHYCHSNPTIKFNIDMRDAEGKTLLHHAAEKGDLTLVYLLLLYGAKKNCLNNAGDTPISLAYQNDHLRIINYFTSSKNPHTEYLDLIKNLKNFLEEPDQISEIKALCRNQWQKRTDIFRKYLDRLSDILVQPNELVVFPQELPSINTPIEPKPKKKKFLSLGKRKDKKETTAPTNVLAELNIFEQAKNDSLNNIRDKVINPLNSLIKRLENIKDDISYLPILEKIHSVILFYNGYSEKVKNAPDIAALKQLQQPKVQVASPGLGFWYLSDAAYINFDSFFSSEAANEQKASHDVKRRGLVFFKGEPDGPGIEGVMASVSGDGSAVTELLFMQKGQEKIKVLGAAAVLGEGFDHYLLNNPEPLKNLDPISLGMAFILNGFRRDQDGKQENFHVNKYGQLICIDGDEALADPIIEYKYIPLNKIQHQVGIRNIVWLLLLEKDIDPAVLAWARLLGEPEEIVSNMFEQLNLQNKQYKQFLDSQELNNDEREKLAIKGIPIQLVKGEGNLLLNIAQILYKTVRDPACKTYGDILKRWYPKTYAFYKKIHDADYPTISEAYDDGIQANQEPMEVYIGDSMHQEFGNDLGENRKQNIKRNCYVKDRNQPLAEEYKRFLQTLANNNQLTVLIKNKELFNDPTLEAIIVSDLSTVNISDCKALDENYLIRIAKKSSKLEAIHLTQCPNITGNALHAIIRFHKQVFITLDGIGKLEPVDILKIAEHCEKFELVINHKVYPVKPDNPNLFQAILDTKNPTLTIFALLYGMHRKTRTTMGQPILHYAIQWCPIDIVSAVLAYRVKANEPDYNGHWAIDIAYQYKKYDVIPLLIEYGETDSENKTIEKFTFELGIKSLEKQPTNKRLREKLIHFALINSLFLSDASALKKLITPQCAFLDWQPKRRAYTYKIDDTIINALVDVLKKQDPQKTRSRKMNIAGIEGVTANHITQLHQAGVTIIFTDHEQALLVNATVKSPELLPELPPRLIGTNRNNHKNSSFAKKVIPKRNSSLKQKVTLSRMRLQVNIKSMSLVGPDAYDLHFKTAIAQLSNEHSHLEILEIISAKLTDKKIKQLADALSKNKSLRIFVLNKLHLSNQQLFLIANALIKHPSLTEWELEHTDCKPPATVEELEILAIKEGESYDVKSKYTLIRQTNPSPKMPTWTLVLQMDKQQPARLTLDSDQLQHRTLYKKLFPHNQLIDISQINNDKLFKLECLTELLTFVDPTSSPCHAIAEILGKQHLKHLNLRYANIGDVGICALSQGFNNNRSLNKLNVNEVGMTYCGMQALYNGLMRNGSIQSLDVQTNDYTKKGSKLLLNALEINSHINDVLFGHFKKPHPKIEKQIQERLEININLPPEKKVYEVKKILHTLKSSRSTLTKNPYPVFKPDGKSNSVNRKPNNSTTSTLT